jgi:predicted Na+-dependent transporter
MMFGKEYYLIVLIVELITFPILFGLFITRFIKTIRRVLDHSIKISPRVCLVPVVFYTFYFSVSLYILVSNMGRIEDVILPVAMILVGLFLIYGELGKSRISAGNAGKESAGL